MGRRKGISVIGTGDFTHPAWAEELRASLVPAEPGLFRLREDLEGTVQRRLPASCRGPVRFLLSVEISTIYKRPSGPARSTTCCTRRTWRRPPRSPGGWRGSATPPLHSFTP